MGIFSTTLGLRRLLVELRGLRRAAERLADALELQVGAARPSGGQSFRGFSRERTPSGSGGGSVSYVDGAEQAILLERAETLTALLGRTPTDAELEAAFRGDIEP